MTHLSQAPETGPQRPKTPEVIAQAQLSRGRAKDPAWQKANRRAEKVAKQPEAMQRIQIATPTQPEGVRSVRAAEYRKQYDACPDTKQEPGLPHAFLCVQSIIGPYIVGTAAKLETNVRVATRAIGKNRGQMWVTSADIPWTLSTAGYLNVSRIDPAMLGTYRDHEHGHHVIAEQIRDRLAQLLRADLDQELPTPGKPRPITGANWEQRGVDSIIRLIDRVKDRYKKWWNELLKRADASWDAQEQARLGRIAGARTSERKASISPAPPKP